MKVVISGGSGFIGHELIKVLLSENHEVTVLTRSKKQNEKDVTYVQWLHADLHPENEIEEADVFINLAGVSINEGRWTSEHQKQIYESRMTATDELLRIIHALPQKPSLLINASAIGIYPASEKKIYTEESTEVADGFLAKTVHDWEQKASTVEEDDIRVAFVRFGIVLGANAGALPLMSLPYKFFVGGTVGSGEQWLSWVHVHDVARAIAFVIQNEAIKGPVNVTSPFPKRMKYFGQAIGTTLKRPHWLPVPSFAMKLALGKKSELVLTGQHVLPKVLEKNGFEFSYPSLESALEDIYDTQK